MYNTQNELLFIPFFGGVIIADWIYYFWHLILPSIADQSQTTYIGCPSGCLKNHVHRDELREVQ